MQVNMPEAKTQLSKLVERAAEGGRRAPAARRPRRRARTILVTRDAAIARYQVTILPA